MHPGGVRSFFQDRKKSHTGNTRAANSASAVVLQQKKREGYDKSRPLQPLSNKSNNQPTQYRQRSSKSEPNLQHSSKVNYVSPLQCFPLRLDSLKIYWNREQ